MRAPRKTTSPTTFGCWPAGRGSEAGAELGPGRIDLDGRVEIAVTTAHVVTCRHHRVALDLKTRRVDPEPVVTLNGRGAADQCENESVAATNVLAANLADAVSAVGVGEVGGGDGDAEVGLRPGPWALAVKASRPDQE